MANILEAHGTQIHSGDLVRVHYLILEGDKERTQVFEGMVIAIRGRGSQKSFTVRKISTAGIGVERIFPSDSPWIAKLEVKKPGSVKRAKLYYVRAKSAREVARVHANSSQSN